MADRRAAARRRVPGRARGAVPGAVLPGPVAGMLARVAGDDQWRAWSRQVAHAGHCLRPVRVRGGAAAVDAATGEVVADYSTADAPDGTLLLACKDRRESVCPACAERYRRDTWHVVAAGMRGRTPSLPGGPDAVPEAVRDHPLLFATFTAPSFGRVHRVTSGDGVCRAGAGVCRHGLPVGCGARHAAGDALAGTPLCWDCYDYDGHVLWHAAVPELWRRTITYAYRAMARLASARLGERVTVRAVRDLVRISYVKVAEFQRRGAVHLHAVIRVDGVDSADRRRLVAPPAWADAVLAETAVREAAGRVAVALPAVGGRSRLARWGAQLDMAPVSDPERAAAYLAKYATKTASGTFAGLPPTVFGVADLARVSRRVRSPHVMLLVTACLRLARRPDCARFRLAEHVHTLGFAGHFASKSRRWSVTLGTLRAVRRAWRMAQRDGDGADPWARAAGSDESTVIVRDWRYVGTGWARPGDADLAATLARDHGAARAAADIATITRNGGEHR